MTRQDRLRAIARDAMRERGFLPAFAPGALAEAQALAGPAADAAVRDLTPLGWASIDNDDSRDLDQLSAVGEASARGDTIYVAIADVDALVRKGSHVDNHAAANTTSVYTAAEVFPMLPERLCTDLTSLNPGVDRIAVVVEMTVGAEGALVDEQIYRARVRNRAKLAYDATAAWLDAARAPPPPALAAVAGLDEDLRRQHRIAQAMKRRRQARGALELDTLETRPLFFAGTLSDLAPDESNSAKELIEDFMVAANGVVARRLAREGATALRRVLRTPQRWDRIRALAAQEGARLPALPDALALDAFLRKARRAQPDRFCDLSLAIVKLLGNGEYVVDTPGGTPPGHFALAVDEYTHATAPNRRFPDLVTQRILKAVLEGRRAPYGTDELERIAAHCTEREHAAGKVERRVAKSAAALLLSSRVGETFRGIVTGASEDGTWVRIANPTTEGRVVKGMKGLDVGDRVTVQLVRTDVDRGYIDFVARR